MRASSVLWRNEQIRSGLRGKASLFQLAKLSASWPLGWPAGHLGQLASSCQLAVIYLADEFAVAQDPTPHTHCTCNFVSTAPPQMDVEATSTAEATSLLGSLNISGAKRSRTLVGLQRKCLSSSCSNFVDVSVGATTAYPGANDYCSQPCFAAASAVSTSASPAPDTAPISHKQKASVIAAKLAQFKLDGGGAILAAKSVEDGVIITTARAHTGSDALDKVLVPLLHLCLRHADAIQVLSDAVGSSLDGASPAATVNALHAVAILAAGNDSLPIIEQKMKKRAAELVAEAKCAATAAAAAAAAAAASSASSSSSASVEGSASAAEAAADASGDEGAGAPVDSISGVAGKGGDNDASDGDDDAAVLAKTPKGLLQQLSRNINKQNLVYQKLKRVHGSAADRVAYLEAEILALKQAAAITKRGPMMEALKQLVRKSKSAEESAERKVERTSRVFQVLERWKDATFADGTPKAVLGLRDAKRGLTRAIEIATAHLKWGEDTLANLDRMAKAAAAAKSKPASRSSDTGALEASTSTSASARKEEEEEEGGSGTTEDGEGGATTSLPLSIATSLGGATGRGRGRGSGAGRWRGRGRGGQSSSQQRQQREQQTIQGYQALLAPLPLVAVSRPPVDLSVPSAVKLSVRACLEAARAARADLTKARATVAAGSGASASDVAVAQERIPKLILACKDTFPGTGTVVSAGDALSITSSFTDDLVNAIVSKFAVRAVAAKRYAGIVLHTTFAAMLMATGDVKAALESVVKFTEKYNGTHLDNDIIIPFTRPGHWVFVRIRLLLKCVECVDSMGRKANQDALLSRVFEWVKHQVGMYKPDFVFNRSEWTVDRGPEKFAVQTADECGVYVALQTYFTTWYGRHLDSDDIGSATHNDLRMFAGAVLADAAAVLPAVPTGLVHIIDDDDPPVIIVDDDDEVLVEGDASVPSAAAQARNVIHVPRSAVNLVPASGAPPPQFNAANELVDTAAAVAAGP